MQLWTGQPPHTAENHQAAARNKWQQGNQRWQTSPAAPPGIYRNFIWGVRTSTPVDLGNYNA